MNITTKIIISDTNIITDLCNAKLIDSFIEIDNIYISDLILQDEINSKTGDVDLIGKIKTLSLSNDQLIEAYQLTDEYKSLSTYDCMNYILARDNDGILATGDKRLISLANDNNVEIIRTLKIIELMYNHKLITKNKLIKGLDLLTKNDHTRIPIDDIEQLIKKYTKDYEVNPK